MKAFNLLTLLCTVGVAAAANDRTVMLWVYRHDNNTQLWQEMVDEITAHKANLTHISMCTHRILENGTFGFQAGDGVETGKVMYHWADVIVQQAPELIMTPLIDAAGTIEDMTNFMQDSAKVDKFFSDAVAMAQKSGYKGYNMDVRLSYEHISQFGETYMAFVKKFVAVMHQHNLTLTDNVSGNCPPLVTFNGETCYQLIYTEADTLYTWSTFQQNLRDFESNVIQNEETFGKQFGVAMSNTENPNILHSQEAMDFAVQHGVKDFALWAFPDPLVANTTVWSDIGYFLHYAQ